MTIDTQYLDADGDKIKLARSALLDMAQRINNLQAFSVTSIANLRLIDKTKAIRAIVLGYYAAGDGGGGVYWYDSTDTTTADNGGTVIVATDGGRWKLIVQGQIDIRQFGAKGDNLTDDSAAVSAAITYIMGLSNPPNLYISSGLYKITSALPDITKPITIEGSNARVAMWMFSGAATLFKIKGSGLRAADVKVRNIGFNGASMTGGYIVEIDFAQNIVFENVLMADPYNGVYIRQSGSIKFNDCLIDKVRGLYGVLAYGESVARNGENDQIDILTFHNTVIQSTYVPGGATSTAELLVLDGRVHTVQINGLRLLSAKRGIVTKNTPAVAANLYPRFITGDALEIESMSNECSDFQYCLDFWIDGFFAHGSESSYGVKLGSNVSNWNIDKGSIGSNWAHGIYINGAKDVTITSSLVYNNSLVGANIQSGIYVAAGSGAIDIRGGLAGKATWLPAYTENQKYGIDVDAGFTGIITADCIDVRGNITGGVYDLGGGTASGSSVKSCPGYNPKGASLQTVGASPYTYTAGLTTENINLYGGAGVVSTVGGVAVANASPCSFMLAPRQSVTITYTSTPTMAVSKA